MQAMDDATLLREYVINNSEAAFEALVSRYLNFVHSAAMRQVHDPQMAEEVAQVVFIILAKKTGRINDRAILSGWLFKTTRFVALTQSRAATRRLIDKTISGDRAVLHVHLQGREEDQTVTLKKNNGEWKIDDIRE
jgi:DNA-directed RNA polymerase specialized sigma24 family protein